MSISSSPPTLLELKMARNSATPCRGPKIASKTKPVNVSIFIQTLNEAANIEACLECFRWADDIVVLDSYSSDKTEDIVRRFGARWIQHGYEGRAAHQNWAMENIAFKHPWVYYTDADERVPPSLTNEIIAITSDPNRREVAYRVRRKDHFNGRWLKHSTGYPFWIVRLFKPDKIRWSRKANPIPEIDGPVGTLSNDYLHYPFSKGLADWVSRHNRYSTYEAEETIKSIEAGDLTPSELFARDMTIRRNALKRLSFRLPCRPILKFFYLYFAKGGFLDGREGFHYCTLQLMYEYLIVLKVREFRDQISGTGVECTETRA
jgi:glycosyltransferase involved in cell wall biosynthesis